MLMPKNHLDQYDVRVNNFHGQNLRGKSFKNQNLSQANFRKADIRGADFTGANLIGADFSEAKAGLQLKSKIILVTILFIFAALIGFISTLASFWLGFYLTWKYDRLISSIIFYLILIAVFLIVNMYKGLLLAIGIMPLALAATAPVADILTNIGPGHPLAAGAGAGAAVIAVAGIMLVAITVTCTRVITKQRAAIGTIIFATVGAVVGTLVGKMEERFTITEANPHAHAIQVHIGIIMALIVTVTLPILSAYIAWISLPLAKNSNFIPGFATNFAAIGGTSFRNANLTEANFTKATLNSTNFQDANITRTRWFKARELKRAKLVGTILSNSYVRDLLVTFKVNHKFNFIGLNFKGANLAGADLSYIDLTEADISEATFAGASLEHANLTKAQAIKTNFQQTRLTGACLEAWNIDSTTELSGAICKYVYLLNNQRERRPSSGEFQPGEFTKLFEEVLDTVDLIFRNGIDWKAFAYSFNQLQVENAGTELFIRSIENKGDGVVVVRVDVPGGADKEKIYSDFSQFYDTTVKIVEEKYRSELESKDKQIDIYRQHLLDLQKVLQLFERQPINIPKSKVVILKLGEGDFNTGFPVTLQIGEERKSPSVECVGKLPSFPQIAESYKNWQSLYRQSLNAAFRIDVSKTQITNFSISNFSEECNQAAETLKNNLNTWLNFEQFRTIKEQMLEELNRDDAIRIILQTENELLRRLPWHLWDLFERYLNAEIAISNTSYRLLNQKHSKSSTLNTKVKILVILGYSFGINVQKDRIFLERFTQDAEITSLTEPTRKELQEQLWRQSWDILYFAGHSSTSNDGIGQIRINQTDKLTITDLKYALSNAIENGLQLAIFNSCDGLGLGLDLANLNIPQMIVMRELVPDKVAQEFLTNFLKAFVGGKSLYQSVRDAREQLHHWENWFPCSTWLPVIFQNPAEIPPTWHSMQNLPQ